MSRNRKIVIASVLVVVLGAIAWALFRAPSVREPVYAGKTLNEWLEVYDPGHAILLGKEWEESEAAIRNMDTNAIPFLLLMLQSHDSALKVWFMNLAAKQHFINLQLVPEDVRRQRGEMGLKLLGPRAEVAVPALFDIYEQNPSIEAKEAAANILFEFPPPPGKGAITANDINIGHSPGRRTMNMIVKDLESRK